MYEAHWGLRESPFRTALDSSYFFASQPHDEALSRLSFLVNHQRRLGILASEKGCGKTLLLRIFAEQMRKAGMQVVTINMAALDAHHFLWMLSEELVCSPNSSHAPEHVLWQNITHRLREHRYQQHQTVFLLDDVGEGHTSALQYVYRLLGFALSIEAQLTVVLSLRADKLTVVDDRLRDLCDLRIDVTRWTQNDVSQFLRTSLARAGRREAIFNDPACTRLFELSRGVPRRVCQLAETALLAAAGAQCDRDDADLVQSAHHELNAC